MVRVREDIEAFQSPHLVTRCHEQFQVASQGNRIAGDINNVSWFKLHQGADNLAGRTGAWWVHDHSVIAGFGAL